MTNKTITLPHCRVQVVEVFNDSDNFELQIDSKENWYVLEHSYPNIDEDSGFYGETICADIELPSGNWQLIGVWPEITEEQAAMVVDRSIYTGLYGHYVNSVPVNIYCYNSSTESLRSLLTANNLDHNKRWAILKDGDI